MLSKRSILLRWLAFFSGSLVILECLYFSNKTLLPSFCLAGWLINDLLLASYIVFILVNKNAGRYHNGVALLVLVSFLLQWIWMTGVTKARYILCINIALAMLLLALLSLKAVYTIVSEKAEKPVILSPFIFHVLWVFVLIFLLTVNNFK